MQSVSSSVFLQQAWQVLGWTMLYFLAAGTLVLLIGAAIRVSLRRANPRIRYTTSLAIFGMLALLPILIVGTLTASLPRERGEFPDLTTNQTNFTNPLLNAEPAKLAKNNLLTTEVKEITEGRKNIALPREEITSFSLESMLDVAVGYLPWLWCVGTPLTFLLLTSGLIGAERLRKSCTLLSEGPIQDSCERLRSALGIGRQVGIAICERVTTPLLVGVVKPLILLPPAALTGWSPEHLEMVLLHELAHVRRWDNAVNLAQRIVESLLFFHPAVWIVSTWVRRDREDCCDAVVVGHTAKPQAYAELLLALASHQPLAGLAASAMAQHPLASRIRRILKLEDEPMRVSRNTLTIVTSTALALALGLAFLGSTDAKETVSRESKRVGDERSAEELTTNQTNGTNKKLATEGVENAEKKSLLFPTLEEQKAADFVYKLLGVELESLNAEELERVKFLGYSGGLKVASGKDFRGGSRPPMAYGDLLVGLYVWPTESLDQVQEILTREDLDQLSPLKFYVIRSKEGKTFGENKPTDYQLVTGRTSVNLDAWREVRGQSTNIDDPDTYRIEASRKTLQKRINRLEHIASNATGEKLKETGREIAKAQYEMEQLLRLAQEQQRADQTKLEKDSTISGDSNNVTLLYDGKTFDQWRELWKTELKTEKRIECIDAFVAFGRAGRGQEAAEAILEVAEEYDFGKGGGTSSSKLRQAIVNVLTDYEGIEAQHWLPLYMERLDANPEKWSPFAEWVLATVHGKAVTPYLKQLATDNRLSAFGRGAALAGLATQPDLAKDQEAIDMIRKAIKGNDPQIVLPIVNHLDFNQLDLFPEQIEILVDKNDQLRNSALRRLTQTIHPSLGIPILNGLLAILYDPTRAADHPRAILAIGSLNSYFNNNQEMAKRLPEVLHKLNDILIIGSERLHPATLATLGRLTSRDESLVIKALGDKITDERRQQLEQAIEQAQKLQAESRRGGGMGGGMGGG